MIPIFEKFQRVFENILIVRELHLFLFPILASTGFVRFADNSWLEETLIWI